jgi:hypothetical protein
VRYGSFCRPSGTGFLFFGLTPDLRPGQRYAAPSGLGFGGSFWVFARRRRGLAQGLKPDWKCGLFTRRLSAALPRHCLRYEMVSTQLQG